MRPNIDLDVQLVRDLCKGDPANLPRFVVHDNPTWPWGVVRIDNRKRIHLRRSDFNNVVAPAIPVVEGPWLGPSTQLFRVQLRADHLDGGSDTRHFMRQAEARKLVLADDAGRTPHDQGYGEDDGVKAIRAPKRKGERFTTLGGDEAISTRALPYQPGED